MNIEQEIQKLHARNHAVEQDKAWETSTTRKASIAVITYGIATLFLYTNGTAQPFLAAVWPVVGYLLSTISLPVVRTWWARRRRENKE